MAHRLYTLLWGSEEGRGAPYLQLGRGTIRGSAWGPPSWRKGGFSCSAKADQVTASFGVQGVLASFSFLFLKKKCIYVLERGRERENEKERNIDALPLVSPQPYMSSLGTKLKPRPVP